MPKVISPSSNSLEELSPSYIVHRIETRLKPPPKFDKSREACEPTTPGELLKYPL
ncbi:hypothetical protein [Prochlorococcus marinus]|uniref:hypothetical protein n=1 Tax=Prochlorococcus marinus TaxID=1219 RepID=UPI0022B5BC46|nr:hypothetical protein [Prochlorococcus marinus]